MKRCLFGAQFLNKRPDSVDRSLIGDPTRYPTKKLDLVVEFDAFFTHDAARQNYFPYCYDDFAANWLPLRENKREKTSAGEANRAMETIFAVGTC
jgi:hypothetical protein